MTMMAIGGVLGAGFFLGVGGSIQLAGPAVVISYAVGGLLAFCVLALLVEMTIAKPIAGAFQHFAQEAFGPQIGFATGWTYWLAFLIGPASETIAAGTFLHIWFPAIPIWAFALAVAALMTVVNLISVIFFGEVEFWLSLIKVLALVTFIIWGAAAVTNAMPDSQANVGNLVNHGGFAPAGAMGIFGAMMLVMFSYGGTEAIGTAAEESENPARDMPKVLRSTIFRIVVLFLLSVIILTAVLPWTEAGTASSPFVEAMRVLGGPVAANIMNFVVLTAALSCIDSGIYATSRMMYSMAREGFFPDAFARLSGKHRVPRNAILISTAVLFLGALIAAFAADAYVWLASFSGFGFMFAWLMIAMAQGPLRKKFEASGTMRWKAPAATVMRWTAIVLILATMVGQLFIPDGWKTLVAGVVWLVITVVYYQATGKRRYLAKQKA